MRTLHRRAGRAPPYIRGKDKKIAVKASDLLKVDWLLSHTDSVLIFTGRGRV